MRALSWRISKSLLFKMDAERAHIVTAQMISTLGRGGGLSLRLAAGIPGRPIELPAKVLGISFANRLGLAAGFDKDAEMLHALPLFGFGFAEVGTVTPRPQPGNPRPRLFRDPERLRLFNCMGFNNQGAAAISRRVFKARETLPADFRVGVNVGKNKDTPLKNAADDYADAVRPFEGAADYVVINVSSPNTPGLRSLQTTESLKPILSSVLGVTTRWKKTPPVLLKLAPELDPSELGEIFTMGEAMGAAGWVMTNTLAGSRTLRGGGTLKGGWSGSDLTEISRTRLGEALKRTRLPIISVGGIMEASEARARVTAGAALVQIYTGWIYGGPTFPSRVALALDTAQRHP